MLLALISSLGLLIPGGLYGSPCYVEVFVATCQNSPAEGFRVVLAGEQVAEELGGGKYCFREVPEGRHDLIVYGDYGEYNRGELVISPTYTRLYMESMVDACIGTSLTTVSCKVTDGKGKPLANAEVCVDDLLIYINADKKGNYTLDLPPGEWTVRGQYINQSGSGIVTAAEPVEGGDEKGKARLNLVLK